MTCTLYRHFDAEDRLLYVGITDSLERRTKQHKRAASWAESIDRIEAEELSTREHALAAEKVAIQFEAPLHNKPVGGKPRPRKRKPSRPEKVEFQGPLDRFDGVISTLADDKLAGVMLMAQFMHLSRGVLPEGTIQKIPPERFVEVANMGKSAIPRVRVQKSYWGSRFAPQEAAQ